MIATCLITVAGCKGEHAPSKIIFNVEEGE